MKKIFAPLLLITAIAMTTSCNKTDVAPNKSATSTTSSESIASKSLTIFSADKTVSTTLKFTGPKELLNKVNLDNMELTLVPTDNLTKEELTVPGGTEDKGFSKYTKDAELLPAALDKLAAPKDAIQVEFPTMQKIGNYALDVKSKDQAVASSADLAARFWYGYGYHTIKVTNKYIKPIYVYFLYNAGGLWHYAGYNFKLNYNTYATYWNCLRSVGAEVDYPAAHSYRVVFFTYC